MKESDKLLVIKHILKDAPDGKFPWQKEWANGSIRAIKMREEWNPDTTPRNFKLVVDNISPEVSYAVDKEVDVIAYQEKRKTGPHPLNMPLYYWKWVNDNMDIYMEALVRVIKRNS